MPKGRPTQWIYKIRKEGKAGVLNVPPEVFRKIPDGMMFSLNIEDNGLLYTPLGVNASGPDVEIPWANTEEKETE